MMLLISQLQMIKIEVFLTMTNQITFTLRTANCNTCVSSSTVPTVQPRVCFQGFHVKQKREESQERLALR